MNELQVKTINLSPAKVEFNYKELEAVLDESLKKYTGLTFTEDDATECKKTIAELNKGKKALDAYRKETKKELTASVTDFENQCKELNKKFDQVINPLKEQHDQFEVIRQQEKRLKIQAVIDQLIEANGIAPKHTGELLIQDTYLTKTKTMKSITEELTMIAERIKMKQEKEEADRESIKATVSYANAEYKVNLSESAYLSLLDYRDVKEIKKQIMDDSHKEVEKRLQAERRLKEQQEREQLEKERQEEQPEPIKIEPPAAEPEETIPEPLPFEDELEPDPFQEVPETVFEKYQITGTEQQLHLLETFMTNQGIEWEVLDDE